MDRETLKTLIDEITDIQRRTVRLGGRIHLTAYYEPDHEDIVAIPDDIDKLKIRLDILKGQVYDNVLGLYDVVWFRHTPGDPEMGWRLHKLAHYPVARVRADHMNSSDNAKLEGYFGPVSVNNPEYKRVFSQ